MKFIYGKNSWKDIRQGEKTCYLLGNGLGGFSSLTVTGANARNDHALLMAAVKSPVERYHMVTNIHAAVALESGGGDGVTNENNSQSSLIRLESQRYVCRTKNQKGYRYLESFSYEYLPRWQYKVKNVEMIQTVAMKHGENTVIVDYEINASGHGCLILTPWFQFVPKGKKLKESQTFILDDEKVESNHLKLYYKTNGIVRRRETVYCDDLYYDLDAADGREALGCAASNHQIECHFKCGTQHFYVVYSTKRLPEIDENWCSQEITAEINRQKKLVKTSGLISPEAQVLVRSANQYLTRRDSTNSMTMIAGYPFFGDWGRDTMIAMAGCTITAKQFDSAKSILRTFMAYCKRGMMPNMFPEDGDAPIYNTVDAALLFIEIVYLYEQACGDSDFLAEAWPVMQSIIEWYSKGTDYHIFMDSDGLVSAGEGLEQLTWMDVRAGNILPTPRHGKPVEINAYWYNALKIMECFAGRLHDEKSKALYGAMAQKTKKSFLCKFWDEKAGYLKDVISGTDADTQIRCNQVWALTMSFTMPDQAMAKRILDTVYEHLYTPWGLRSLSTCDKDYHGTYGGAQFNRDMAYHQGTVWAFPLGGYYMARLRWADDEKKEAARVRRQLEAMIPCLYEGCVGHIAEIYDGDCPSVSKGCFAQAWSVGEILRVYEKLEQIERSGTDD